jgi:predicted DNA-binding WGR domain protein
MAQLVDDEKPTNKDVKLLIALHDAETPCLQTLLQRLKTIAPTEDKWLTAMADMFTKLDQYMLALAKRQISWGEYNKINENITKEFENKAQQLKTQELATYKQAGLAEQQEAQRQQQQQNLMLLDLSSKMLAPRQQAPAYSGPTNCQTTYMGQFANTNCY